MQAKKAHQPGRTKGNEEFDDMPPLEYVGVNPAKRYSFLEGDKVRLTGLLKADLNGQCGTIMNFLNAARDRIPVKLDSGAKMAIKPDNLEKLSGSREDSSTLGADGTKGQEAEELDDDDDNDMPPLEYVGGTQEDAKARKEVAGVEDGDDDDMPPLEHMGTVASAPKPAKKDAVEDDDDDMPPLECVGAAASDPKPCRKGVVEDDDDDMPPLEYVGAAASDTKPGKKDAVEDDDDDMPPLEYVGAAASDTKPGKKDTVEDDDDDDDMPPLDYVGTAAPDSKDVGDEDDDGMPPLEYAGTATSDAKACAKDVGDDDDDDDMPPLEDAGMPPLEYVGIGQGSTAPQDDDDMPPLEYVGAAASDPKPCKKGVVEDDDDDMPPLEYVGAAASDTKSGKKDAVEDDDDDMPPLEYVGAAASDTKPGKKDAVEDDDDDDDDDDMPPLDYVGTAAPDSKDVGAPPGGKLSTQAAVDEDEDEDDMPPLEDFGTTSPGPPAQQSTAVPSKPCQSGSTGLPQSTPAGVGAGDLVVLKGLRTAGFNGERARVLAEDPSGGGRIQVALLGNGRKLSVKPGNVTKVPRPDSEVSDDSMPPLDDNEPHGGPRAASSSGPAVANKVLGGGHGKGPEALIDLMKEAMQSSSVEQVARAIGTVEAAQGVEWGDLLPKKKQLLRKLRLKRRKLEPLVDESPVPEEVESAQVASSPGVVTTEAARALAKSSVSDRSSQSDKDWFFLGAEAKTVKAVSVDGAAPTTSSAAVEEANPRAAVMQWCKLLQLPSELAERLVEEDVTDPSELTGISNEELAALTKGLKIGPKGRFMKAVQRMRHLEQSELGSTC